MLYSSNATLQISIRQQLPPQAQDLHRETFNEAWAVLAGAHGHSRQGRWALGGMTSELRSGG